MTEGTASIGSAVGRIHGDDILVLIDDFGRLSEGGEGVTRLGYTALERAAHARFADELRAIGAEVHVDAAGNSYGELPPTTPQGKAAIGTGSHLDSVPSGGRFDGIAGVCTGIAVFRAAVESGLPRTRPWRLVAFACEEGARFGQACNGSRAVAGLVTRPDLDRLAAADGLTLAAAMRAVELDPDRIDDARWQADDWSAFVELHVEQGNVLESTGVPVGIVDSISGSSRLQVSLHGTASHTGGTPMHLRRDALTAAAEVVLRCENEGHRGANLGTRVTVGRLDVSPDSITTIPGTVDLTIDVRDFDSERQRGVADRLCDAIHEIAGRRGIDVTISRIGDTSPVLLPSWLVDELVSAAESLGTSYRIMPSGASHDSQQINTIVPTAMIFTPSAGGLSHVPEEWTTPEDLEVGARLLLTALTRLDARD